MGTPNIKPYIPPSNRTRSTEASHSFDRQDAEPLGARRVLTQVSQDLYGTKDVQDAITASYVWLADQLGHITLGGLPTLILCVVIDAFSLGELWSDIFYVVAALAVFTYWVFKERDDFVDVKNRAGDVFPFNSSDIEWNVKTALFYFALGGIVAAASFVGTYALIIALVVLVPMAVRIAYWWLKRKLAFQQAGLPYLYRLANYNGAFTENQRDLVRDIANLKNRKVNVLKVLFGGEKLTTRTPKMRHLVISGPMASGKTSLAVGIGTEFAFALGLGRYLSAAKLLGLAMKDPKDKDRMEFDDGRTLWPWEYAELLIVDDVDVGVASEDVPKAVSAISPGYFEGQLKKLLGNETPLRWLKHRRSVWVVGDPDVAEPWCNAIRSLIGIGEKEIEVIKLGRPRNPIPPPPPKPPVEAPFKKKAAYAAGAVGALCLLVSALWWWGEGAWGRFEPLTPKQAFVDGSFGLELAPLKYFLVMSDKDVSAKAMQVDDNITWDKRFGFINRADHNSGKCVKDAPGNLPLGFSVSNRLPLSATPVPVKFAGLTCAACHSTQVGDGPPILGAATQTADLIGFQDAYTSAILDTNLNAELILSKYEQICGKEPGLFAGVNRFIEAKIIDQWLAGTRDSFRRNATKYDMAFHGKEIGDPQNIPPGPSRSRPFRSVIRNALDLPGSTNYAISKMPAAFMQRYKGWSQYDASIQDVTVRSMVAVFASGASIPALNEPQIAHNVRQAATFTMGLGDNSLGEDYNVPKLTDKFPDINASADLTKGQTAYMQYCDSCHGHPDGKAWVMPWPDQEEPRVMSPQEIGTDRYRIEFRYAEMLPLALASLLPFANADAQITALTDMATKRAGEGATAEADFWDRFLNGSPAAKMDIGSFRERAAQFPARHHLAFASSQITLRHGAQPHGYQLAPIPFVWLRAPYLHNGSIPTVRALLVPSERPAQFCRGQAKYDPKAIGLEVTQPNDGKCPDGEFLFDSTIEGNSNKGHDKFPIDPAQLDDLLAYLRTI